MSRAMASAESMRDDGQRGRIDKRKAILDAAVIVFSRQGFAQACVKEIAFEAGVAKPTIYNHLNDKENLFRHAMAAAADRVIAENLAAVSRLSERGGDARASLEDVGYRILTCYCDEQSAALRRLLYAEASRFPDLVDLVQGLGTSQVTEVLADRLARLALAGQLPVTDPVEAAEQFIALLTGPMEARSRFGTRRVPNLELRTVARTAVRTFLRAIDAEPAGGGPR